MGMFNYVKYEAPCSKCGFLLKEFQTKSSDHDLRCEEVDPSSTDNFYVSCRECGEWNEYEVVRAQFKLKNPTDEKNLYDSP